MILISRSGNERNERRKFSGRAILAAAAIEFEPEAVILCVLIPFSGGIDFGG
jgi:hypothetical protein